MKSLVRKFKTYGIIFVEPHWQDLKIQNWEKESIQEAKFGGPLGEPDFDISEQKLKNINAVYKTFRKGVVTLRKGDYPEHLRYEGHVAKGKYRYELPKTFDSVIINQDLFHIQFNEVFDNEATYGIRFYVSRINDDGTETRISPKDNEDFDIIDIKNYVLLAVIKKFERFNITI